MGTERWIAVEGLKLNVIDGWKAWFGPDKQLAGYTQTYDGLVFKTVKGGGHMVAATRPLHALYMFECFIFGSKACSQFSYPKDVSEYLTGDKVKHHVDETGISLNSADFVSKTDNTAYSIFLVIGFMVCFAVAGVIVFGKFVIRKRYSSIK